MVTHTIFSVTVYDTACIGACPVSLWSTLIEFTIAVLVRSSPPIAGHFTLHEAYETIGSIILDSAIEGHTRLQIEVKKSE